MASKIVPEWHALVKKREALEELFLEKHRVQLDNADPKEQSRIKKQIEKQIEQTLRNEFQNIFGQKPWIR